MFIEKRIVQTSEIGSNHVIRAFDLVNMIQDVEGLHIDHLDQLNMESKTKGFAIVLNFRHIRIHQLPRFKDQLKIQTNTFSTNPFFGSRNTIIYDKNEVAIIESYCVGSFIKLEGMKPYRLSKDALDSIKDVEPYPMTYVGRKINIDNDLVLKTEIIVVKPSFIDYYQHLNNAYYVDFAVNLLPNDFNYHTISCEYRIPYSNGEEMILELFKNHDGHTVKFLDHERKVHALIQFGQ